MEVTERWDPRKPESLRYYPKSPLDLVFLDGAKIRNYYHPYHWEKHFPQIKSHTITELKKRLLHFERIEKMLAGPVNGYDIELQLRHLARRAGARNRNALRGIAGGVEAYFTRKQRRVLFGWLNEITENIKWKGIDSWAGIRDL